MAVWGPVSRSTGPTPDGHSEGPDPAYSLRLAVIELQFWQAPGCYWAKWAACDLERDLSLPRAFSLAGGLIP